MSLLLNRSSNFSEWITFLFFCCFEKTLLEGDNSKIAIVLSKELSGMFICVVGCKSKTSFYRNVSSWQLKTLWVIKFKGADFLDWSAFWQKPVPASFHQSTTHHEVQRHFQFHSPFFDCILRGKTVRAIGLQYLLKYLYCDHGKKIII